MYTLKTNIDVDKILKGVLINKNNDINYIADIVIELENDAHFEYAIAEDEQEDNPNIKFKTAKKFAYIKHKNLDNVFRKSVLLLKSEEKSRGSVNIELEPIMSSYANADVETLGPRGTVLLNRPVSNVMRVEGGESKPWYKNPWILGGILLVVYLFVKRKSAGGGSGNFPF